MRCFERDKEDEQKARRRSQSATRKGAVALLAVALAVLFVAFTEAAVLPSPEDILSVVPGSKSFRHETRPLDIYLLFDGSEKSLGAAFVTSGVPPEVGGYRDEIDVLVGMDMNGRITGAKLIGHSETPELIKRIVDGGFLKRFVGRGAAESFDDIEAVTGATISSQAIIDDIKTSSQVVASRLAKEKIPSVVGRPGMFGIGWQTWAGSAVVIMLVLGSVAAVVAPRRRYLRNSIAIVSVAVIGFWLNMSLTIGDFVDLRNLSLPGVARLPLVILIFYAIIASLIRGNLYCLYLCPFGILQTGVAALKIPRCNPSARAEKAAGWLRWIVTIVAIYAIASLGSESFRTIEPFSLCFSLQSEGIILIQTAIVLVAAIFVRRVWCRYLCPTGLILDIFTMIGAKVRYGVKKWRGACGGSEIS